MSRRKPNVDVLKEIRKALRALRRAHDQLVRQERLEQRAGDHRLQQSHDAAIAAQASVDELEEQG